MYFSSPHNYILFLPKLGVAVDTFNPNTWEAEVDRSVNLRPVCGLYSEFQDNQGYIDKPCLKKGKTKTKTLFF